MKRVLYLLIFCVAVSIQIAYGQNQTPDVETKTATKTKENKPKTNKATQYPNLKTQAEDVAKATLECDFGKVADYTHPKVTESIGGKEKMVAFMKEDSEQIKADGFEFVSAEIGEIQQIEIVENELFALIPIKMIIEAANRKAMLESLMVGISNDNGENWKFISGVSQAKFNAIFPKAAEKIHIPDQQALTMIKK